MWRKGIPGTLMVGLLRTLNPVGSSMEVSQQIDRWKWDLCGDLEGSDGRVLWRADSNGPSVMDTLWQAINGAGFWLVLKGCEPFCTGVPRTHSRDRAFLFTSVVGELPALDLVASTLSQCPNFMTSAGLRSFSYLGRHPGWKEASARNSPWPTLTRQARPCCYSACTGLTSSSSDLHISRQPTAFEKRTSYISCPWLKAICLHRS